jgi:hypothetical protein
MTSPVWGGGGDLLWETPFTFLPDYNNINVNSVATSSNSFIISGFANYLDSSGTVIGKQIGFIKAFDTAQGNIKWEYTLTLGANGNSFNTLGVESNVVVVNGGSASFSGTPPVYSLSKGCLRGYNADTGQLL